MLAKRLIKSNNAGGGCTNTVDLYNPFPDGGGLALYQLNGDATDVSGNYDGTATNITYGTGQFGQAANFSSNDAAITANTFISSSTDTQDFSISMWFKHDGFTTPVFKSLIGANGSASQGVIRVLVRYVSSNTYTIDFARGYNSNFYSYELTPNITLLNSSWYNLVVTFNSSLKKVEYYLNGSLISYANILNTTSSVSISNQIVFGQYLNSGAYPTYSWGGSIDQVRIFSRALRPYEVEALYTEEYCTPTIVPSEHFNAVTYTGDGGTQSVTSVGFQSDFVWLKSRDTGSHFLHDSVRGINNNYYYSLISNATHSESVTDQSWHDAYGRLSDIGSNGFTVVAGSDAVNTDYNKSGEPYVSWNFKAGGAAVSNTDGTITSQVSANTEAGFSVVSYTGDYVSGSSERTVGHGLNSKPDIFIIKNRTQSMDWYFYTDIIDGSMDVLYLNKTDAKADSSRPISDSSVFYTGGATSNNINGNEYIVYCFAEV